MSLLLRAAVTVFVGLLLAFTPCLPSQEQGGKPQAVTPKVTLTNPAAKDQDDMCIWIHPLDPEQSTVIASDKKGDKLFVYDLQGKVLQTLPAKYPGNIDLRYAFALGKEKLAIVAVNLRSDLKIAVFKVDDKTRLLERVDNDAIRTGENYGGTLFRSSRTGKVYFVTTSKSGAVEQYELADNGAGKVAGKKVRNWRIGLAEAAVGDDETGMIYLAEERKGIWKVSGEPGDPVPGNLVVKVGENGLIGDVEGLAFYCLPDGKGYLLVSNQGGSNFKIYERAGNHAFVGTFTVEGATHTDGLDVSNANLGKQFPNGVFACHTHTGQVLLTPWEAVAKAFAPGLSVDTSWNPRKQ